MKQSYDPVHCCGEKAARILTHRDRCKGVETLSFQICDVQAVKNTIIDVIAQISLAEAFTASGYFRLQEEVVSGAGTNTLSVCNLNPIQPAGNAGSLQPDSENPVVLIVNIQFRNEGLRSVCNSRNNSPLQLFQFSLRCPDSVFICVICDDCVRQSKLAVIFFLRFGEKRTTVKLQQIELQKRLLSGTFFQIQYIVVQSDRYSVLTVVICAEDQCLLPNHVALKPDRQIKILRKFPQQAYFRLTVGHTRQDNSFFCIFCHSASAFPVRCLPLIPQSEHHPMSRVIPDPHHQMVGGEILS